MNDVIKEEIPIDDEPNISPNISPTKDKSYQCDAKRGNIINHQRIHSNEKPYQCDVCNKKFTEKGIIVKHHRIHSNEKPYQCDVCDKQFTRRDCLAKHQRIHSKKNMTFFILRGDYRSRLNCSCPTGLVYLLLGTPSPDGSPRLCAWQELTQHILLVILRGR